MSTQTFKGYTYENGEVPSILLARLDGENYGDAFLRLDAAESWNRARADVLRQTGLVLTVRGWMRSEAEQEQFFHERYKANKTSPFSDYRYHVHNGAGAWYGRTNGAAAAIPGTSNHGWGTTVDVVDFGGVGEFDNPRRVKAIEILKRHGWDDTEGRSVKEPWHLMYIPSQDTHPKPPRTFHRRYATSLLPVYTTPGNGVERVLPVGSALSVVDGSGRKVGDEWYAQTTTGNWVLSKNTSRYRPYHIREVTSPTHTYDRPAGTADRLLPVGTKFSVWDGSARKVGKTWWVQTTAGNWIRSINTEKV